MRPLIAILLLFTLAACDDARKRDWAEYDAYRAERTLVRACASGAKIWSWRGSNYTDDLKAWPDAKVSAPIDTVC